MTYKYLYPFRKRVEILSALYAGGFGFYILFMDAFGFSSPIGWLPEIYQALLAHFMILASFTHAVGVSVNGRWAYSPVLRVLGLSMHAGVMATFIMNSNFSSAGYTYTWIFCALLYGVISAMKDFTVNMQRGV